MKAARRVDNHEIGMPGFGGGERVKQNGGGIGSGLLLDHLNAQASGPDFQLLIGGGAKSVRRAEQRLAILLLEEMRQLGDAGGLADSVDSYHEDDGWHSWWRLRGFGSGRPLDGVLQNVQNCLLHRGTQLRRLSQLSLADLLLQAAQNLLRCAYAKVGGDQRGFKGIKDGSVES